MLQNFFFGRDLCSVRLHLFDMARYSVPRHIKQVYPHLLQLHSFSSEVHSKAWKASQFQGLFTIL